MEIRIAYAFNALREVGRLHGHDDEKSPSYHQEKRPLLGKLSVGQAKSYWKMLGDAGRRKYGSWKALVKGGDMRPGYSNADVPDPVFEPEPDWGTPGERSKPKFTLRSPAVRPPAVAPRRKAPVSKPPVGVDGKPRDKYGLDDDDMNFLMRFENLNEDGNSDNSNYIDMDSARKELGWKKADEIASRLEKSGHGWYDSRRNSGSMVDVFWVSDKGMKAVRNHVPSSGSGVGGDGKVVGPKGVPSVTSPAPVPVSSPAPVEPTPAGDAGKANVSGGYHNAKWESDSRGVVDGNRQSFPDNISINNGMDYLDAMYRNRSLQDHLVNDKPINDSNYGKGQYDYCSMSISNYPKSIRTDYTDEEFDKMSKDDIDGIIADAVSHWWGKYLATDPDFKESPLHIGGKLVGSGREHIVVHKSTFLGRSKSGGNHPLGQAVRGANIIMMNMTHLGRNAAKFNYLLEHNIPHEIGHLVEHHEYGYVQDIDNGHGPRWHNACRRIGYHGFSNTYDYGKAYKAPKGYSSLGEPHPSVVKDMIEFSMTSPTQRIKDMYPTSDINFCGNRLFIPNRENKPMVLRCTP